MNIAEFHDLYLAYSDVPVLNGLSFSVQRGQIVALLGRTGAGKTTLLQIAMGTIKPRGGTVRLFGEDPRKKPVESKRRIGFVAEHQTLPKMNVGEWIELHRALFPTWDDDLAEDLIHRFETPLEPKAGELDKREARRLALVCALAHRPELLLLDLPDDETDPAIRCESLRLAVDLLRDDATTILWTSGYMGDAEQNADRFVILDRGLAVIDDSSAALREKYGTNLIEAFTKAAGGR